MADDQLPLFYEQAEPKPCPFCGARDPIIRREDDDHWLYFCILCGTWGPIGKNKLEAAEKWNGRREK